MGKKYKKDIVLDPDLYQKKFIKLIAQNRDYISRPGGTAQAFYSVIPDNKGRKAFQWIIIYLPLAFDRYFKPEIVRELMKRI